MTLDFVKKNRNRSSIYFPSRTFSKSLSIFFMLDPLRIVHSIFLKESPKPSYNDATAEAMKVVFRKHLLAQTMPKNQTNLIRNSM
jgi:sorbitol-specific phosphotransferase system component IIC